MKKKKNRQALLGNTQESIMQEYLKIPVTPRQTLHFTLVCSNANTPKVQPAKRALAEVLISKGFSEKDLVKCKHKMNPKQSFVEQVESFLNGFQNKLKAAGDFVELVYSRGWLDDTSVNEWFTKVSDG